MLSKKAKKKLAHQILAMSFNFETESTFGMLRGWNIDATEEDAAEITELVAVLCDKHEHSAHGWAQLIPNKSGVGNLAKVAPNDG